jgi:hypothetical protein
MSEEAMECLGK